MTLSRFALFLLIFLTAFPLNAQKKKGKKKAARTTKIETVSPEVLVNTYRFAEAIEALEEALDEAVENDGETAAIRKTLQRALLGNSMLSGVAKITFVDSFLVARDSFFMRLPLSADAGRIAAMKGELPRFSVRPCEAGSSAFINDFGDRLFYSAKDSTNGVRGLYTAYKGKNGWGGAERLEGMQEESDSQDFPFMMPDGVTLYFASKGEESLGGYDLFVTRYDAESKRYLKAENLGMPFSSPYDDYMVAMDEAARTGYLVTERGGDQTHVCVYIFEANEDRMTYTLSEETKAEVIRAARIQSVSESQTDPQSAKAVVERRKDVLAKTSAKSVHMRFVINDNTVYKSLSSFRSEAARRIAEELLRTENALNDALGFREDLQRLAATGKRHPELLEQLTILNRQIPELREKVRTLGKNMRQAELKQ